MEGDLKLSAALLWQWGSLVTSKSSSGIGGRGINKGLARTIKQGLHNGDYQGLHKSNAQYHKAQDEAEEVWRAARDSLLHICGHGAACGQARRMVFATNGLVAQCSRCIRSGGGGCHLYLLLQILIL